MDTVGRRTFLGLFLGGLTAVVAAAVGYPVFRYLAPRRNESAAGAVVIPEADLVEGQARFFQYDGAAAVLVRMRGGKLVALSAVCTHLGCIVQWEKEKQDFLCPCHAGHYSPEGDVISGPPPRPLTRIPFKVANGSVTIGAKQEGA